MEVMVGREKQNLVEYMQDQKVYKHLREKEGRILIGQLSSAL
jgi:hypothetical protein